MNNTREWLKEITGGASVRSVADRIGEYNVTLTRRLNAGDAHTITAIAREYGVSPVPGLIAAGILTESDLADYQHRVGLDAYDDLELAEETVRRIQERQDSPLATVTEFPGTPQASAGEQGEPENATPNVLSGGYDPSRHAAYNGEDEDTLRRQEEGDWTDPNQIP